MVHFSPGYTTAVATTTVTNSGALTTTGDFAVGIAASSDAFANGGYTATATATTTVNNSGAISTSGLFSAGIEASSNAYASGYYSSTATATTTVTNSGAITTSGDIADGIDAFADAGGGSFAYWTGNATAIVNNSGTITTTGYGAYGIFAEANDPGINHGGPNDPAYATAMAAVYNSGAISTSGDYASGIVASSYASAFSPEAIAYSTTIVTNRRDDQHIGLQGACGIVATSVAEGYSFIAPGAVASTASSYVNNAGMITTSGAYSPGITAKSNATAYSYVGGLTNASAMTSVVNSGQISVSGTYSDGIDATSYARAYSTSTGGGAVATTSVINSGKIAVTGDYGTGIFATASAVSSYGTSSSAVLVTNSGSVSASGSEGIGVFAVADQVTITNAAGGAIAGGTGTSGAGIWALGSNVTVNNSGTIGSANDHAVVLYGATSTLLDNKVGGTVTGFVTMYSPSITFDNLGTWVARGGNSDFTPSAGGSSIVVNSGKTLVVGNQVFVGLGEFENAGLLSLSSKNANMGTRPAYEKLEVTGDFVGGTGSVLEVGSNMTTTSDVLKVDGPISGSTKVQVDELGAPGLTTGSGILVVDASTGSTSAGNFSLVSNSSASTLVDNAYEYSLGLVPGTGGHGAWYLTSKLYPGTYAFSGVASSGVALANFANGSLLDIFDTQDQGPQQQASDAAPVRVASTDNSFVPTAPLGTGVGFWGRYNYASMNMSPTASKYGDYSLNASSGNIGFDLTVHGNGQTGVFGLMVNPFSANASFDNFSTAHMSSSGTGISGYFMWIGGPWHAGMIFTNDSLSTLITDTYIHTNAKVKMSGFGFQAASSYDGWLDDGVYFDPGASISLQQIGGSSFVDGAGNTVTFGSTTSLVGHLNVKVGSSFDTGAFVLKPYGELGVNYEFDGQTPVTLGNYSYTSSLGGATVKVGGGFTADINQSASFFVNADYIGGDKQSGVETFVGVRIVR